MVEKKEENIEEPKVESRRLIIETNGSVWQVGEESNVSLLEAKQICKEFLSRFEKP